MLNKIKKDYHTYLMYFWILMIIPTLLWWKESVLWVALMSLYANIEASASAREAKKTNDK
jgi:hypothetical protein